MDKYILSIDQGTTSCRAMLYDRNGQLCYSKSKEFKQIYPKPGWVEHDPMEIWETQLYVIKSLLKEHDIPAKSIATIGISNQRETVVIWEKASGQAIGNAIVWQCRRTAPICEDLKERGLEKEIYDKTGLVIDPYFSASKLKWILDKDPGLRDRAKRGELLAGTIDSWLIWQMTRGKAHVTDYTNASRTMLFNIKDLCWDDDLIELFDIPKAILPEIRPSVGHFGYLDPMFLGQEIPICGVAGDQQAALFGQACFNSGDVKNTYGTGCFILMNTGNKLVRSNHKLLSTIAWGIGGEVEYALEGSIFVGGAAIQWLRDELGILENAAESERAAESVSDTQGLYMVPAFTGLGAPHWDMYAKGALFGITRGVNFKHIIRATLESIAYQSHDLMSLMEQDSGIKLNVLKVDGGASANNFLMQFQADLLKLNIKRPANIETTSQGVAFMSGLEIGYWQDKADIEENWLCGRSFTPKMEEKDRVEKLAGWDRAVKSCMTFR